MSGRSTVRILAFAWLTLAAILALVWFFKPEAELPRGQVDARYELQRPRHERVGLEPAGRPGDPAPVDSAGEVAGVDSDGLASIGEVDSWALPQGTGRISGTVTARETGRPVGGVLIEAGLDDDTWRRTGAVSAPDGTYELRDLPAGPYVIVARSGPDAEVGHERPRTLQLAEGGEEQLDLDVSRAGRVWGTVTDAAGRPVKGVMVLVTTTESVVTQMASMAAAQRQPLADQTDERGAYVVHGVPFEREWQVWFNHDDHAPVLSPSFVLHETRPHLRVDVSLLRGSRLSGQAVEPSGRPVPRAQVMCMPRYNALLQPMRRAQTVREVRCDDLGRFVIEGMPAGEYQLLGFHDGYRIAFKGMPVYPDGRTDIEDLQVLLRPVSEGDHVVLGRVVDADGAPVASAHVGLATVGLESLSLGGKETTSAADGSFHFEGLGEGSFLVVAKKDGFRQRMLEGVPLDRAITVELEREAGVRGVVLLPDGAPAPSFHLRVVRVESEDTSLLSRLEAQESGRSFQDAAGRFELRDVPPGRVLLEASSAGLAPGRLEVEVARGQATSGVTLRLPAEGATIRGRVTAPGGAPVAGARVTLAEVGQPSGFLAMAGRRRARPEATSDARGEFVLGDLAAATYDLEAAHADHAPTRVRAIVARAGQPETLALTLKAGGRIEGAAPPGVMVTVAGEGFSAMSSANEAGRFKVERVPEGEYLVRVVESDAASRPEIHRRTARVADGKATLVDFVSEDQAGRTVEGRVQAAPAKGVLVMVLLRIPGSPPPDPADLVFQGQLGVSDPESSRFVVAEALAQEDGAFVLEDVPPGRYTLDVYEQSLLGTLAGGEATLLERRDLQVD